MINPIRWSLNKLFPFLKNEEPEYPVGTTGILELTYSDGTKNYIPEIYEKESLWLPFIGDIVNYEWWFYSKAVITRHFYYDENWISDYYNGKNLLTREEAVNLINAVPRDKIAVKYETHIIEP